MQLVLADKAASPSTVLQVMVERGLPSDIITAGFLPSSRASERGGAGNVLSNKEEGLHCVAKIRQSRREMRLQVPRHVAETSARAVDGSAENRAQF